MEIPWKSILTSKPFYALILVQCAQNFGFYTLLTQIPSYLSYVMGFDIKKVRGVVLEVAINCFVSILQNSLLSALPYFVLYITCLVFGFLADYVIKKKIFSVERSRKTFNSLGHYIPMCALIGLGFMSKDNPTAGVALLTVAVGINGGIYSGYMVNHIDLSPIHSGILMGISNFLASLNSIMGPLVTGWIVTESVRHG